MGRNQSWLLQKTSGAIDNANSQASRHNGAHCWSTPLGRHPSMAPVLIANLLTVAFVYRFVKTHLEFQDVLVTERVEVVAFRLWRRFSCGFLRDRFDPVSNVDLGLRDIFPFSRLGLLR
jgi:hypothetical protein